MKSPSSDGGISIPSSDSRWGRAAESIRITPCAISFRIRRSSLSCSGRMRFTAHWARNYTPNVRCFTFSGKRYRDEGRFHCSRWKTKLLPAAMAVSPVPEKRRGRQAIFAENAVVNRRRFRTTEGAHEPQQGLGLRSALGRPKMRSEVGVWPSTAIWACGSASAPSAMAIGSPCASNTAHAATPPLSVLSLHRAGRSGQWFARWHDQRVVAPSKCLRRRRAGR